MCRIQTRDVQVEKPSVAEQEARCKLADEFNSTAEKCAIAKQPPSANVQRYVSDNLLANNAALASALDTAYPWSIRDADGMISKRDLKAFLSDDGQRQTFAPQQVQFVEWLYRNWDTPEINQFKNRNLLSMSLLHDAGRPEVAARQKSNDYNLAAPLAQNNYALFDVLDTARQSTLGDGRNATVDGFITRGDLKWFLNNPELNNNFNPDQLARVKYLHDNWYSNEVQRLQENGGLTRHSIARAVGQGRYNPLHFEPLPPDPARVVPETKESAGGQHPAEGQPHKERKHHQSQERNFQPHPELQVSGNLPKEIKLRPGESLYGVAKEVLAARTGNTRPGNDEIFRECNRIMVLNGFKDAGLDGKKNITSADLPAQWNGFRNRLGGTIRISAESEGQRGDAEGAARPKNVPIPVATALRADADVDAKEIKDKLESKGQHAAMAELKVRLSDAELLHGKDSQKFRTYAEQLAQQLQQQEALGELSARWAEANANRFSREGSLTMYDIEEARESSRASVLDKVMLDGLRENYNELSTAHRDRWFFQSSENEYASISRDDIKNFAESKEKQRKERKAEMCRAENL